MQKKILLPTVKSPPLVTLTLPLLVSVASVKPPLGVDFNNDSAGVVPTSALAVTACVWLVALLLVDVAVNEPGVFSVTALSAVRLPPPPNAPLPVMLMADRAIVLSIECVWLVLLLFDDVADKAPGVLRVTVRLAASVPPPPSAPVPVIDVTSSAYLASLSVSV